MVLEEVHRFPTGAVRVQNSLRWNVLGIFEELKQGLQKIAARDVSVSSLSVDSWGVDYVLFNDRQPMVALPYQYRDSRTEKTYASALAGDGREKIFAETGIQFMAINTLYHLIADVEDNPDVLSIADHFLTIADYMNYLFSGVVSAEVSLVSTTQLYNPIAGKWSDDLIQRFSLPGKLFPNIVPSGTRLGPFDCGTCGGNWLGRCPNDRDLFARHRRGGCCGAGGTRRRLGVPEQRDMVADRRRTSAAAHQ